MWRLKYAELYADQLIIANQDDENMGDDFVGMTKEELEDQVFDIFGDSAPLPFRKRKGQ